MTHSTHYPHTLTRSQRIFLYAMRYRQQFAHNCHCCHLNKNRLWYESDEMEVEDYFAICVSRVKKKIIYHLSFVWASGVVHVLYTWKAFVLFHAHTTIERVRLLSLPMPMDGNLIGIYLLFVCHSGLWNGIFCSFRHQNASCLMRRCHKCGTHCHHFGSVINCPQFTLMLMCERCETGKLNFEEDDGEKLKPYANLNCVNRIRWVWGRIRKWKYK